MRASTALSDRGPSAWDHPFIERAIGLAAFNNGMRGARHLGGNSCIGFTPEMRVIPIFGNIAFKLVPETVGRAHDRNLPGHPEGASQSRITVFGKFRLPPEGARLMSGKVHPAKLQKLSVMANRRKSPASARIVRALMGPIPGSVHKS